MSTVWNLNQKLHSIFKNLIFETSQNFPTSLYSNLFIDRYSYKIDDIDISFLGRVRRTFNSKSNRNLPPSLIFLSVDDWRNKQQDASLFVQTVLSFCLSVCLSISHPVRQSLTYSLSLSVCLSVYLSVSLTKSHMIECCLHSCSKIQCMRKN